MFTIVKMVDFCVILDEFADRLADVDDLYLRRGGSSILTPACGMNIIESGGHYLRKSTSDSRKELRALAAHGAILIGVQLFFEGSAIAIYGIVPANNDTTFPMKPSCLIDGKSISHSTKLHLSKCICDQTFFDTQQLSLSKNRTLLVNDTYATSCYLLKHYLIFPDKISSTSIPTWTSPKAFGSKTTYKSTSILIMALVIRPASAVLPDATTTSVSSEPKPELVPIIVGAILGAITLLTLIFLLWSYVLRKRRQSQKLGHTPQSLPLVDYPSVHNTTFTTRTYTLRLYHGPGAPALAGSRHGEEKLDDILQAPPKSPSLTSDTSSLRFAPTAP